METRDLSLSPERVRPADSVQDGNSRFCTVICQRGGFSSFPGSEKRVFSDPDPSIFEEAIEVHVGGDGLPVPSPVFRTVDCSPGILDDWLVLSSSEREAKQAVQSLLSLCHTLGIVINEKKSDLVPSQTAKYLGMIIDTEADKVFPSSLARVEKFLTVAESFCTMDAPPPQLWQVILGHLASLERLVPHGRLRMCTLQWHLKAHWSPEQDPPSSSALATGSETGPVLVDSEGSSLDGGSIRDTCAGSSPVFGRVLFGMGRSPSRSTRVRGVV